jgi:hypothetical protein
MTSATWTSLLRRVLTLGSVGLALACTDDGGNGPEGRVRTVEVTVSAPLLFVGTTGVATARVRDADGEDVDGVTVRWRSSAPAVIDVSATGVLSARTVGAATITAEVGSVTGAAEITVQSLPVASVSISSTGTSIARGQTTQLQAEVRDQLGAVLTGRPITWSSGTPGVASVSGSGLVTGISAGTTLIRAVVEEREATALITVVVSPSEQGPHITAIEPALLAPGVLMTVRGSNFSTQPSANEVRVNGVVATVLTANATELSVLLPSTGFSCTPTQQVFVQVARGLDADALLHPLQSAPLRALAVGESAVLTGPGASECFELPSGGGRYALSVYNVATVASAATGFRLRGVAGIALAADPAPVASPAVFQPSSRTARSTPRSAGLSLRDALHTAELDAHARLLEANRSAAARGVLRRESRSLVRASAVSGQAPVGSVVPMRIPNVGGFLNGGADFCQANFAVNARVVYNGTRAIVLEDTATVFNGQATLVGQSDSLYRAIGEEFDANMFGIVEQNFGSPLRMDDQLDNNGKIIMLFSPRINSFSGLSGFVVSCDFFPPSQYPSSNRAEVFYAIVPSVAGTSLTTGTRNYWYWTIRSTIIHETKHIAAYANRIRDFGGTAGLEDPWLEEGTARHAEEIWARKVAYNDLPAGANATYATTLFCDPRPLGQQGTPQCLGKPYGMYRHFGTTGLYDFLRDPEPRSPLGPRTGSSDFSYYASAWSLVRWAIDNHPITESAALTGLVRSSAKGVANVSAVFGRPWDELLGEWSLALYLDDRPGFTSVNPRLRMPSWNMPSLYQGMAQDFPATYTQVPPLRPRDVTYGAFEITVPTVGGGSFSLFELSGQQDGRQLIQLLGVLGSPLSPTLRVALVRVQ